MANKSFGTKQLDLTGASGSPIITSPSDLSINATTVAISTNVSVGGYFGSNVNVGTGYSVGIGTTIPVAELEVRGDIGLSGSIVSTANTITVKTSGSERLRITPDGDVGIGTAVPTDAVTSSNTAKLAVGIITCHELYANGNQIIGPTSGAIVNPAYSTITVSDPINPTTWADALTLDYKPTTTTARLLIQVSGEAYGDDNGNNGAYARIARLNSAGNHIALGMQIDVDQKSSDYNNGKLGRRMDQTIIDDLSQIGTNAPYPGDTQYYKIQIYPFLRTSSTSCRVRYASILISEILA